MIKHENIKTLSKTMPPYTAHAARRSSEMLAVKGGTKLPPPPAPILMAPAVKQLCRNIIDETHAETELQTPLVHIVGGAAKAKQSKKISLTDNNAQRRTPNGGFEV